MEKRTVSDSLHVSELKRMWSEHKERLKVGFYERFASLIFNFLLQMFVTLLVFVLWIFWQQIDDEKAESAAEAWSAGEPTGADERPETWGRVFEATVSIAM